MSSVLYLNDRLYSLIYILVRFVYRRGQINIGSVQIDAREGQISVSGGHINV